MTSLLLLLLVSLWLWACVALTRALLRRLPRKTWRPLLAMPLFLTLAAAPVGDEIVGAIQFHALCRDNAIFRVNVQNPEGRITRYSAKPANERVSGTVIEILDTGVKYVDIATGEVVVTFHKYVAKGGWLIRALGVFQSNAPLTIGQPTCSPEQRLGEAVNRTLKFSVVN